MKSLPLDTVVLGDCLVVLRTFPDSSVDCVICDPPYGLGTKEPTGEDIVAYLQGGDLGVKNDFMNKDWQIPSVETWKECLRVLKPGGHLLSFAGTRTWDLMSVGIRAAGFEDRDTIANFVSTPSGVAYTGNSSLAFCHGQGFPKSHNALKTDILPEVEKQLREQGVEGVIEWRK
jgi:tRNA G10  N-methylase Trm11